MASKINNSAMALFLALNLLFFSMASVIPKPTLSIPTPTPTTPKPSPTIPKPTPSIPTPTPTIPIPTPMTPLPTPSSPQVPTPTTPSTPQPSATTPSDGGVCPIDALKLGVCANMLGSLFNLINIGNPPVQPCYSLINGLFDLDAAVCLCTAIRANNFGINLNVPLSLSLLLSACSQNVPSRFQCP